MRIFSIFILISCISFSDMHAQAIHSIDITGANLPAGRPSIPPKLLAIAGKPMEIHWTKPEKTAALPIIRIDRITDTRKTSIAPPTLQDAETKWILNWKPPVARGPAHYEIQIEGFPSLTVRIETRDPDWIKSMQSQISVMDWQHSELKRPETTALTALGFKLQTANDAAKHQPAFLRMIPKDASAPRREITWDETEQDLVVWSQGATANDLRIRAPRWWISPEALKTDQGLIRILDLYFEIPNNP